MNASRQELGAPAARPLLEVEALHVAIRTPDGEVEAVRGVSFALRQGETLGVVGESGSGKTLTALAILRVLPHAVRISGGRVLFEGENLGQAGAERMRMLRRHRFGYIPQDPHAALHPSFRIRDQISEGLARTRAERRRIESRAVELLSAMGLPDPGGVLERYPHELSGGMKQRIVAATALVREPALIIADEPTSALDVTVQAQLAGHLKDLVSRAGASMLFISHDLGVVNALSDAIAVMYGGEIVEYGSAARVTSGPAHPYTRGLLDSLPALGGGEQDLHGIPGRPVTPGEIVTGCRFAARCPLADEVCRREAPGARPVGGAADWASCWRVGGA